jgi:outer membrane protein OmpA-like peptidoglycan-associated protein
VTSRTASGVAIAAVLAGSLGSPQAQQRGSTPSSRRQFVACPIVRDTRTQPCWLAEYDGELFYLGQQGGVANDFYPPQLGHLALVEGTVGTGRMCGGTPLQPVKVSVLRELSPACRTMLPAEDGIDAPPPVPAPRGDAPSWVRHDGPRDVTLYFDFDSDFFALHVTVALTEVAQLMADNGAVRVEVTGYRAATRLSSGQLMTEREGIGGVRARKVADTLAGLGVSSSRIAVNAPAAAELADGVNDPWRRRVDVRIR